MTSILTRFIKFLFILCIVVIISACSSKNNEMVSNSVIEPINQKTATLVIEPSEQPLTSIYSGLVIPKKIIEVKSHTNEVVKEIKVKSGGKIKKGDVILYFEEWDNQLEMYNTDLREVENSEIDLRDHQYIWKCPYDKKPCILHDKLRYKASDQEIKPYKDQVEKAKEKLTDSQQALNKLVIKSPSDGIISELDVQVGEMLDINQLVLVIIDVSEYYVSITNLKENNIIYISEGENVDISFPAIPISHSKGIVSQIVTRSDGGLDTKFDVNILIINPPENIRWGITTNVRFE